MNLATLLAWVELASPQEDQVGLEAEPVGSATPRDLCTYVARLLSYQFHVPSISCCLVFVLAQSHGSTALGAPGM